MAGYMLGAALLFGVLLLVFWDVLSQWMMKLKKPIFVDTSAEAMRKAEDALKAAKIPFTLTTTSTRPGFMARNDAAAAAQAKGVLPYSKFTDAPSYVYTITVRTKYREQAAALISR